jgi:hypothetical protein
MTTENQRGLPPASLVGYAVLRANFNYDAPSYVENFRVFILDALARRGANWATEAEVAHDVRQTFGFTIPDRVVGRLLKKAVRRDQVIKEGGCFQVHPDYRAKIPDIQSDIITFDRQRDSLVHALVDHVSVTAPQHLPLIEQDPAGHLSHFVDRHAAPLLAHALRRGGMAEPDEMSGPDFLIASFIQRLSDRDPTLFGYVVDLVKGAILAAVLDTGRTGTLGQPLRDLTLVLDTPILLKALGFQGVVEQQAVKQTLALALDLEAKVVCFTHTVKELDGVLDSVTGVLRSRGRREGALRAVDAHFLDKGTTPADIEIERGNLRRSLAALGVREVSPPQNQYQYGLDEVTLEETLDRAIHYKNPKTRQYDVDSLSAIHRLRRGSSSSEFERCDHVLVTDNDRLVHAARRVDERHDFPLALMDADVAALLWVRRPAVAEDLPRAQLLATVHSGMQPGGHLWARYLEEIERLVVSGTVNEDDALLLRARPEAREALMMQTLGEGEVDQESISQVLDRVRTDLQEPVRTELAGTRLAKDAAVQAAAIARSVAKDEQRRSAALEMQVDEFTSQLATTTEAVDRRAARAAKALVRGSALIVSLMMISAAALSQFDWGFPTWVNVFLLIGGFGFWIVDGLSRFVGGSVREWLQPTERWLTQRFAKRYRRQAGLPEV